MHNNLVIVGDVTAKQYQDARVDMWHHGLKTEVHRVDGAEWRYAAHELAMHYEQIVEAARILWCRAREEPVDASIYKVFNPNTNDEELEKQFILGRALALSASDVGEIAEELCGYRDSNRLLRLVVRYSLVNIEYGFNAAAVVMPEVIWDNDDAQKLRNAIFDIQKEQGLPWAIFYVLRPNGRLEIC